MIKTLLSVPCHIKALPLFKGLEDQEQEKIIHAGELRLYPKNTSLFKQGDSLKSFYVVVEGVVREFRVTPDGKEITVSMAGQGDLVCSSHVFETYATYQWSAVSAEESILLEYPLAWFREAVKSHKALALNLLTAFAHCRHKNATDTEHLLTFTAAQRVACFLFRHCAFSSCGTDSCQLPYSKTTIASRLGIELETFSRTLRTLKAHGITLKGREVRTHDPNAVTHYICDHCSVSGTCKAYIKRRKEKAHHLESATS